MDGERTFLEIVVSAGRSDWGVKLNLQNPPGTGVREQVIRVLSKPRERDERHAGELFLHMQGE